LGEVGAFAFVCARQTSVCGLHAKGSATQVCDELKFILHPTLHFAAFWR